VSKQEHLQDIYKTLKIASVSDVVTMEMTHGNKTSRIVAWRF
jgi:23S rRNA (adenine1618-N6)-methyltransferase